MGGKPALKSSFNDYLLEHKRGEEQTTSFPSLQEFIDIINRLPNWKAAGCDGIYNFFIRKIDSLHERLYDIVRDICLSSKQEDVWFYKGITYLIPKGEPTGGGDFRPITCMSNLYKITTKCVTFVIQLEVEKRSLLSQNQLGTVRRVLGAKEQALLNKAIHKQNGNRLKTIWIDVKKAFDSVNHEYLLACIKSYNFASWVESFLERTIQQWQIEIRSAGKVILEKKINNGILQGDSLSPLLFVLCLDPLSKKLNIKYPKVEAETGDGETLTCNHLLFIDD